MDAHFYRSQAALCQRIGQRFPDERIAQELAALAREFQVKATELEEPSFMPWIGAQE
jgi:hypothetical protein